MKKQLWSLARLTLPALGFALTSGGVCLAFLHELMVVPSYIMIALGFVCMISGVFWSVFLSLKSKMYHRGAPRPRIHVFTIDRPRSFPPSYEESQSTQHCRPLESPPESPSPLVRPSEVVLTVAPPLYSPDSSEAPDCTWSWEPPPRYSQVVQCPTP
ncbi:transmembrane protein 252 [Boleophthalmus pectinirostris]|uniref:transmembrane protein 252 n=1 Tax=Boleophthalmus pectinirostris TaxID=150288 RepID=UPI000A1C3D6C|nr:transmembrane protein 252 [Boleophthalmus pectinirostris]